MTPAAGDVEAIGDVVAGLDRRLSGAARSRALSALCAELDGAEPLSYSQEWAPLAGGDRMPGVRVRHRDAPDRSMTVVPFTSQGFIEMSDGRSVGRLASIYDPLGAVEAIERRLAAAS